MKISKSDNGIPGLVAGRHNVGYAQRDLPPQPIEAYFKLLVRQIVTNYVAKNQANRRYRQR